MIKHIVSKVYGIWHKVNADAMHASQANNIVMAL